MFVRDTLEYHDSSWWPYCWESSKELSVNAEDPALWEASPYTFKNVSKNINYIQINKKSF